MDEAFSNGGDGRINGQEEGGRLTLSVVHTFHTVHDDAVHHGFAESLNVALHAIVLEGPSNGLDYLFRTCTEYYTS